MDMTEIFMDELSKIAASMRSLGVTDPTLRGTAAQGIRAMRKAPSVPPSEYFPEWKGGTGREFARFGLEKAKDVVKRVGPAEYTKAVLAQPRPPSPPK